MRHLILGGILLLLLTACTATTKIPEHPQIETPLNWHQSGDSNGIQNGWITSFEDRDLNQLVREAVDNNPDLLASASKVDRARALAAQAGAALTPTVGLTAGMARADNQGAIGNRLEAGLQIGWEVDLWGRLQAGRDAAGEEYVAAESDYRFAEFSLVANTAKAYFVSIEAKLQEQLYRTRLKNLEETLRIVSVRYENGMVSRQDLALAQSDLSAAKERMITLDNVSRNATRSVELLLGRYPSGMLNMRSSLPTAPPLPPAGVPSEILEQRPDLLAAERRVAASFNRLNQAKAAKLPTISLTSNIGGASSDLSSLLNPANVAWRLAANLLAPIFDGGERQARVDMASAEQQQALANYTAVALAAFGQVETALDQGVTLAARAAELDTALEQAGKAYEIAKLRYQEGEIALFELLSIQDRMDQTRSNLLAIQRLQLDQRINLYLALGGDWKM